MSRGIVLALLGAFGAGALGAAPLASGAVAAGTNPSAEPLVFEGGNRPAGARDAVTYRLDNCDHLDPNFPPAELHFTWDGGSLVEPQPGWDPTKCRAGVYVFTLDFTVPAGATPGAHVVAAYLRDDAKNVVPGSATPPASYGVAPPAPTPAPTATPTHRPSPRPSPTASRSPGATPTPTIAPSPGASASPSPGRGRLFSPAAPAIVVPGCESGKSCPAVPLCPGGFRQPTAAELQFWLDRMRTGVTDEQVLAEIIGSTEYYAGTGGTEAGFSNNAYRDIVGTDPDGAATASINAQLGAAASRTEVAAKLLAGDAYRGALDRGWRVRLFGAQPSDADVQADVAALAGGASDEDILALLVSSDGYYQLAGGDQGWLRHVYADLLGEPVGDTAELALPGPGGLADGPTRTRVAKRLLAGDAYRSVFVRGLYKKLLTRVSCSAPAAKRRFWPFEPPAIYVIVAVVLAILGAGAFFVARRFNG